MKFETSEVLARPFDVARDAEARAEAYLDSIRDAHPHGKGVVGLIRDCARKYPLSTVGAALGGGLLLAAALHRRESRGGEISHRGRHLLYATLAAVAQALRDRSASVR